MGAEACSEHFITFLLTPFPCSSMGSLPWDAIIPALIPLGLPTGCTSPSTAPTQLCTTGPTLQALLPVAPNRQWLPQPSCPTAGCSPWAAALAQGAPAGFYQVCILHASSTAALWAPPLLHREICSMQCTWAAGGTACSSMGLSWAVGSCCSAPGTPPVLFLH